LNDDDDDNNNNNKPVLKIRLKCNKGVKGSGNTDVPILKIAHDSLGWLSPETSATP
jgi:hypothetical protein